MSKVVRALALCILVSSPVAAQVGHDPARSPYRPILLRTSFSAVANYIWGSSGKLGVGPSDGPGAMLRYEMQLTGPTDVFASVGWSNLERMIADPAAPADERISGPVDQGVVFTEAGLLILLTGDKTWNRIAPYLGGNMGLAFGAGTPQDSSGYSFSTKFVSGPIVGVRFYTAGALSVRVEGRLQFWKVSYPDSYFRASEGEDPLLNPLVDSDSEWTTHPTLLIGLGYAFRF
jgi:hypothetical protein